MRIPSLSRKAAITTGIVAVAGIYFVAAKLGLRLAFVHPSATPVWPPTGVALAALLLLGYRLWPGVFLGAFFANLTTFGTVWTSLGVATGNTLEGLVGAYLVTRYAGGSGVFTHPRDIFKFALLAALVSTTLSATIGVTSLALGGFARWADFRPVWLTWWLGDATGALIFAPVLILCGSERGVRWNPSAVPERVVFLAALLGVCWVVFGGLFPFVYLTVPFLVWAAFRFEQRETAGIIVLLGAIAVWGTLRGRGPLAGETPNESLLMLQAFMAIMSMVAMPLASVTAQRERADRRADGYHRELQQQNTLLEQRVRTRTRELEEAFSVLRATLDSTADGILVVDRAGRIVSHNRRFAEMWRLPDGDLVGRGHDEAFQAVLDQLKDPDGFLAKSRDLRSSPEAESHDVLEFADGRVFERYSQPHRMNGQSAGRVWSHRDITAHARSLAAQTDLLQQLQAAEARFRGILAAAPDAMILVNAQGKILFVNGQAEQLFGYTQDELMELSVETLVPDRFRDRHRRHRAEYITAPRTRPMGQGLDLHGRRKDGSEVPVEISLSPLHTPEGVLTIAAIRDVTERRQAEERDLQQMQALHALYVSAQKLSQSLDESELADYIVVTAVKVFGVHLAWVGRAEPDGAIRILALCPADDPYPGQLTIRWDDSPDGRGPSGRAIRTGFPVVMDAGGVGDLLPPDRAAAFRDRGFGGTVSIPLVSRDRPFGVLAVYSTQEGFFTPARTEPLQAFAHLAASALENARLLSEAQQRADQFAALYETAQAVSAELDLPALLDAVLDRAMTLMQVPIAGFYLYEASRDDLELVASRGMPTPVGTRLQRGEGVSGRILETRLPVVVDHYKAWEGRAAKYGGVPVAAVVGVPLIYQAELIGVLFLGELEPSPRRFTDADVHLLTLLASHVAGAVHDARLFAAATRRMEHLQALRDLDVAISSSMDLQVTLAVLLDKVTTRLGVDAGDVLLLNPATQCLDFVKGRGFRAATVPRPPLRLGQGSAGRAALERRLVAVHDRRQTPEDPHVAPLLSREGFVAHFAVPLVSKGQVEGVLEIFHRAPLQPDQEWVDFLITLAGQAAIAIDNAGLLTSLQQANVDLTLAYDVTLEGWSRALDLRDRETEGHTQRVTQLTLRLAEAMGVPTPDLEHMRRGALLHDIGKMGIPDAILLKPGPLTEDEWAIMKRHPVTASELLEPITYLRSALAIPRHHHEKWDGTGYPNGLKGEQIPLAARIFAVADVYDALTSDRPYRPAWPAERAREHIREQAGKQFDPTVVEAFLHLDQPRGSRAT